MTTRAPGLSDSTPALQSSSNATAAKAEQESIVARISAICARLEPLAYPLVRAVVGGFLIPHGIARVIGGGIPNTAAFMAKNGLEPAYAFAVYITLLEIVGGAMLVVGLLTRPVAVLVFAFLATAVWVHAGFGFFWTKTGAEFPLYWTLMTLVVLIKGGGEYSIDRRLGWRI